MVKLYYRVLFIVAVFCFSGAALVMAQANTQTTTGTISNAQTSVFYHFDLQQGQAILAAVEATSGSLDTYLILRDPEGSTITENDDMQLGIISNSALGAIAAQSGSYELEVTRYPDGDSEGDYLLQVTIGGEEVLEGLSELIVRVALSGPEQTVDTPHFRIHYTTEGDDAATPEYIDEVARAAEEFYDIEINQLGWAVPPSDQAMGGNNLYDVYVRNLIGGSAEGDGSMGYASAESNVSDNPNTEAVELAAASSYLVIDNDYISEDGSADPISLMRATFAHEFNHGIQFGYDSRETHNWMYESTASWMETIAADEEQDATGYIAYAYQYPEICFGTITDPTPGQLQYGDWPFIQMLADLFGTEAVPAYWEYVAQYQGWESLSHLLADYDVTIPEALAAYRLKNLARDYELAPLFDATVWVENMINDVGSWTFTGEGIQELGANYYIFDMPPGVYAAEVSGDVPLEVWVAGLNGDELEAISLQSGGIFDTTPYSSVYLMVFNPAFNEDANDCAYVNYALDIETAEGEPVEPIYSFPATYLEAN